MYKIQIVNYSKKSIAIFGNTYPVRGIIKDLKGRFSGALKHPEVGYSLPGWVIGVKAAEEVKESLNDNPNIQVVDRLVDTFTPATTTG